MVLFFSISWQALPHQVAVRRELEWRLLGAGRELERAPGFRVQGSGCRVEGAGCRVQGGGCRVQLRVQGSGCRVPGCSARAELARDLGVDLELEEGGDYGAPDAHHLAGRAEVSCFCVSGVLKK